MRHTVLLLLLLVTPAARAQTCAGVIALPLAVEVGVEAERRDVPVPPHAMYRMAVTFVRHRGGADEPDAIPVQPFDSLVAHPETFRVRREEPGLHGDLLPGDVPVFRTACGYALIRFEIWRENGGAPLVLDAYNVPPHIPLRFDAPLVVRPGHLRVDLGGWDGLQRMPEGPEPSRLIPTAWIEAAD